MYGAGLKDACTIFFYFMIAIVLHAVIQEYVLDVSFESGLGFSLLTHSVSVHRK